MTAVGVLDFGSYLPGEPIGLEALTPAVSGPPAEVNPLLRQPATRHHVKPGERAAEMIEKAALPMFERLGRDPGASVDVLLTNVLLPDGLFMGCGAEAAQRLGCTPKFVLDVHNGGCASFPYMLKLAEALIATGEARTALIANVQNAAGQVYVQSEVRARGHAVAAGDGCGVAYLAAGEGSPLLGVEVINDPGSARDLDVVSPDGRRYWEPGTGQIDVKFDETKNAQIMQRGNRLVPQAARQLCERLGVAAADIDLLVTNQPSRMFLRIWRESLKLPPERHADTFDEYGNLSGAAMPITLDRLAREDRLRDGALIMISGFAHAGDLAAAAALRWRG